MFSNSRKTIGVFAENTANEFQHKLCDGIIRKARGLGYNVAIFSSFGSFGQSDAYYRGDMQLYQLPPYEKLAGVILVLDTMEKDDSKNNVIHLVKSRCTCPIISMRMTINGVNNILVDNSTCMEGLIRHFIEDHKLTRLCFMTGPASHFDAVERLECFRNLMNEYHLPVDDHQIFYGDFWKLKGKEACDWFLNGQEKPDAILCANDYMAVAVSSELIRRGYRIPEDIKVCGYDGLDSTISFSPSITTAEAPFYDMGQLAVTLIDQKQEHQDEPKNYYMKAKLCCRESCGCIDNYNTDLIATRRNQYEILERSNSHSIFFSFMSIRFGEVYNMEGISDLIAQYIDHIENIDSYAVCLNENLSSDHRICGYTDKMHVRAGFKDGRSMGYINIPFSRDELLPAQLTGEEPQIWYFLPLHFLDYGLGYEGYRFKEESPAGICSFQYNVILSNKIYDTLVYKKMQHIISELEKTSLQDALTGLYNRGGFMKFGDQLFQSNRVSRRPVFLAVLDMDGLKNINDIHGHVEGDYAIKRVANAISRCCEDKYIFARTGGDEFLVIAQNIQEEEAAACMEHIEQDLIAYNETGKKPYAIHISSGHYYDVPGLDDHLEDFIKVADRFMYHNKIENKRRRGESLR